MSSIGIDFGTSNCFAHVATAAAVQAIRLDGDAYDLPSVVYAPRRDIVVPEISEGEVDRRLTTARAEARRGKAKGAAIPADAVLETRIRDALRREALEQASQAFEDQTFFSAIEGGGAVVFGREALRRHFAEHLSGFLIKSPKAFLGSDMDERRLLAFEDVITVMLTHIRTAAESQSDSPIRQAVLGRPVRYQGIGGEASTRQAIGVMERAAQRAGFTEISFELEPLAAAYEYERAIAGEQVVLVIDVGGGTTDCAMVRLSPARAGWADRREDILGVSGDRVGGTDFDEVLAWRAFMPAFGKDSRLRSGRSLPHGVLHDAISIRDVPAQTRFARAADEIERLVQEAAEPKLLERLQTLHSLQLQHQLVHAAELAKIGLSGQDQVAVALDDVEPGLALTVDRAGFASAAALQTNRIRALAAEAMRQAGVLPDVVFITGGMAISPVVRAAIADVAGSAVPIRSGEMLGTVGLGLGLCAQRQFER